MKYITAVLSGMLLLSGVQLAQADAIEAGKQAFQKHACASCHGDDAKTSTQPDYPILAGQHRDYLEQALMAYRRGQAGAPASSNVRNNAIMGAMAAQLSAEEIKNISAWLATLESPLGVRR